MGLDNYWVDENNEIIKDRGFGLCGGMFSGDGSGSFRGKVYDDIIEEITGVSLYQERIEPAVVAEMADKLAATSWNRKFGIGENEYDNLVAMFVHYAQVGAALVGWW